MRVIFLEVEGVLMPPVVKMVARLTQKPIVAFKPSIDALNLIIKETKAELVIIDASSGALNNTTQTKLKEWGLEITIFDRPPGAAKERRGNRIIKWMALAGEPESFVILDYANKGYGNMLRPYLIIADPEAGGLNEKLARKAIRILNKGTKKKGRG